MNDLLQEGQLFKVVPKDYENSNNGKILSIHETYFLLEVFHEPVGIIPKQMMEFYSQTRNGTLYFNSSVAQIDGDKLVVLIPRKHRFLQRRAFTRIDFFQNLNLKSDEQEYSAKAVDLSAGGLKLRTERALDFKKEYEIEIEIIKGENVKCKFIPVKIELNEFDIYTVAGRFKSLSSSDRMKITQFCIRKQVENENA